MGKAWKNEKIKVVKIRRNLYQIFFCSADEVENVVNSGPWCIDNNLISVRKWEQQISLEDETFKCVKFWFQIAGFPGEYYTKDVGRKVAGMFHDCESIQIRESMEEEG